MKKIVVIMCAALLCCGAATAQKKRTAAKAKPAAAQQSTLSNAEEGKKWYDAERYDQARKFLKKAVAEGDIDSKVRLAAIIYNQDMDPETGSRHSHIHLPRPPYGDGFCPGCHSLSGNCN